jgi:hypothetical protein
MPDATPEPASLQRGLHVPFTVFFDTDEMEQPASGCADDARQHEEGNGGRPIGVGGL